MSTVGRKVASAIAALALMGGLAACGSSGDSAESGASTSGGEASGSGVAQIPTSTYVSTQNIEFMSAYPEFTFKQATFGDQMLELYADGTYRLVSINSMYSGSLSFPDQGDYEAVPRGNTATTLYGTATVTESDGLSTVSLSAPTRAITVSNYATNGDPAGYLDTENWTEEMGIAAAATSQQEGSLTSEDYLASVSFGDVDVIVDDAAHTFDYLKAAPAGAETGASQSADDK